MNEQARLSTWEIKRRKTQENNAIRAQQKKESNGIRTPVKVGKRGKTRFTHGLAKTAIYRAWRAMKVRCNLNSKGNPAYHNYGGRGIKVCERWLSSFENFLADMGPKPSSAHSLDRFPDNNGDCEPGNCRWATRLQQNNNRRATLHDGKTIKEIAIQTGLSINTIRSRSRNGTSLLSLKINRVLTPASVLNIRAEYKPFKGHKNPGNAVMLALKYGIKKQMVHLIARRERWNNI